MSDSTTRKPAVRRELRARAAAALVPGEMPPGEAQAPKRWRLEPVSLILGIWIAVVVGGVCLAIAFRHGGRSIDVTRPPAPVDPEPIGPELGELSQGDQALALRAEALALPDEAVDGGVLRWRVRDGNRATRPFRIETDRWKISWRMLSESGASHPMMLACLYRGDGEALGHWLNSQDGWSMIYEPPGEYYLELNVAGGEAEFTIEPIFDPS